MKMVNAPRTANDGSRLKSMVANNPVLGPAARAIARTSIVLELRRRFGFGDSSTYWEKRYQQGKTSGVGSYGRLAAFKAEVLNEFVVKNGVESVIEFGCGDGTQLSLSNYPRYVGVDVAQGSIAICGKRFAGDNTKKFCLTTQLANDTEKFDLAISLDVVYHLVEDAVFEAYMRSLFAHAGKYIVIYSSNKTEPSGVPHVRHRRFTDWIKSNAPQWQQSHFVPNRYPEDPKRPDDTSFADFYFFQLQT
ncbi:MAG: class I SAM-dependent methyltransferase [Chthoniobacterales bacterium]